jgi:hypothetical protein
MDAKELRIGNLVYVDWKEGRKVQTNYGVFDLPIGMMSGWDDATGLRMSTTPKGYCVHLEIVRPIPLSEKWLATFGFEFDPEDGTWFKGGYFFSKNTDGDFSILEFPSATAKHVHHLQNLYFALTGEELTILQTYPLQL